MMHWEDITTKDLGDVLFHAPSPVEASSEPEKPKTTLKDAAVLFPIICHDSGLTVLFTKRTATLKDHPGQISFPGGRVEKEDQSLAQTALREAQEEISLLPCVVEIMGFLPQYHTITGYCITPVMGQIAPPLKLCPDPREVAEIFEVPLSFLLNPDNHQQHHIDKHGRRRSFHAIAYQDYFIWGATAGIIVGLSRRLSAFMESCSG